MSEVTIEPGAIEKVLVQGDLSPLTESQRSAYYLKVCESVGLNPLTKPFEYLKLNGKLILYATRSCTDQLRHNRDVSIEKLERETVEGVYCVTAHAKDGKGRTDSSLGAVTIAGLKGDALANAMMKAETKSKRRVTLSICGLGMLDETEIETIPATAKESAPALPSSKPAEQTGEQWAKSLIASLRKKESELIAAGKCVEGEFIGSVEQSIFDAGLPENPADCNTDQRKAVSSVARKIGAEFDARSNDHALAEHLGGAADEDEVIV